MHGQSQFGEGRHSWWDEMTRTMSEGRERLSEKDGESEIDRHKGERRRESVIESHEAMKDRGGGGARGGEREIHRDGDQSHCHTHSKQYYCLLGWFIPIHQPKK